MQSFQSGDCDFHLLDVSVCYKVAFYCVYPTNNYRIRSVQCQFIFVMNFESKPESNET